MLLCSRGLHLTWNIIGYFRDYRPRQSQDWCTKPSLNQIKLQASYNIKHLNHTIQTKQI